MSVDLVGIHHLDYSMDENSAVIINWDINTPWKKKVIQIQKNGKDSTALRYTKYNETSLK